LPAHQVPQRIYRRLTIPKVRSTIGTVALTTAIGQSSYTISDLVTLGGFASVATGINNHGQVVGFSTTTGEFPYHAFLYSDGKMQVSRCT
jgi:probable HAF family extracellular repeat protein